VNLYAAAATPAGDLALQLASEGPRTKGFMGYFAVTLMFLVLCGGVFMLLQSSFGAKVGYLMTGAAFFGSWLVLSLIWLTGVPGLPLPNVLEDKLGIPDIEESTPKYTGPQGSESTWNLLETEQERSEQGIPEGVTPVAVDMANLTDQATAGEVQGAITAATEGIAEFYAEQAGVEQALVQPNSVYVIDRTEIVRQDRRTEWVRLTTKPAEPNASASEETKDAISKIQEATFVLRFQPGDLATPTYWAVAIFTLLFAGHVVGLALTDRKPAPTPQGAPERLITV
jgi:hypothetical protein